MEKVKTPLHVLFVDSNRRFIREIYSECYLSRDTESHIPIINILDELVLDMLECRDDMPMPFYDINRDKFNFKCSNIMNLMDANEELPDEIVLEVLEVRDDYNEVIEYIHLEPGLWKSDDDGRYRMCDESILHIVMDTKVIPMVKNNTVGFEDGGAITLFYYLYNNLSFHYFDRDDEDEFYDENCEESDSESDELNMESCEGSCEKCTKFDYTNGEAEACSRECDDPNTTEYQDTPFDMVVDCEYCGCPKKDKCNKKQHTQIDDVESIYPRIVISKKRIKSNKEDIKNKYNKIFNNRVSNLKKKYKGRH